MQILNLPCTNLWLEADGRLLDFELIDVTKSATKLIKAENPKYNLEKSYLLKPHFPAKFNYAKLSLHADATFNQTNLEDILADTWYVGGNWFVDNKAICIVAYVNNGSLEEHANVQPNQLPYYEKIYESLCNELLFQVTYKDQQQFLHDSKTEVDLSLDFASDQMHDFLAQLE